MATTSIVAIANNALAKIGANAITSLSENNEAARAINLVYTQLRNTVLRDHPWNFAIKRAVLALESEQPAFEWTYQFALPSDSLRVLHMELMSMQYEIEGRKLLTNESSAKIRYIAEIADPNQYDAMFIEAFSARLAAELAITLSDSNTMAQAMMESYNRKIADARSIDAQESGYRTLQTDGWLNSRLSYGDENWSGVI